MNRNDHTLSDFRRAFYLGHKEEARRALTMAALFFIDKKDIKEIAELHQLTYKDALSLVRKGDTVMRNSKQFNFNMYRASSKKDALKMEMFIKFQSVEGVANLRNIATSIAKGQPFKAGAIAGIKRHACA